MIAVIDLIRIVIKILIKEFSLRLFASSFFDDLLSILTGGVDLFDFIMRADASKCESILRWLFVGIVHLLQNIFNCNILFIRMILGYFIELDVFNKQVNLRMGNICQRVGRYGRKLTIVVKYIAFH